MHRTTNPTAAAYFIQIVITEFIFENCNLVFGKIKS